MKRFFVVALQIILVIAILMQTGSASSVLESIQVYRNSINISVDGVNVDKENFLFNDTTYVPLRAISEMLGSAVKWNSETNTAQITGKAAVVASADWKEIKTMQMVDPYNPILKISDLGVDTSQIDSMVLEQNNKAVVIGLSLSSGQVIFKYSNILTDIMQLDSSYTLKLFMVNGERKKIIFQTSGLPDITENSTFRVIYIPAMPEKGFNYPYYLTLPSNRFKTEYKRMKRYLLVQPNNTGATNDYNLTLSATEGDARQVGYLTDGLWLPKLTPCFPRPMFGYNDNFYYPHALDRDTILLSDEMLDSLLQKEDFRKNMSDSAITEEYLRKMTNMDKQLEAMIDHAIAYLNQYGNNVDNRKVFMFGFSAAGSFTNRWTALHPDRVKAVVSGGLNSQPIQPIASYQGENLIYPIGTYDYAHITGKSFNPDEYNKVAKFIFQGEEDTNETLNFKDCFGSEERRLITTILGEQMYPARWDKAKELFFESGANANFVIYKGVGHSWNDDTKQDMINFFNANRDCETPVYPELVNPSGVIYDTGK